MDPNRLIHRDDNRAIDLAVPDSSASPKKPAFGRVPFSRCKLARIEMFFCLRRGAFQRHRAYNHKKCDCPAHGNPRKSKIATCAPHTEPEFGGNLIHMTRGLVTAADVPARWSRTDGLATIALKRTTDNQAWLAVAIKQPQALNFSYIARSLRLVQPALPASAYSVCHCSPRAVLVHGSAPCATPSKLL